MAREKGFEAVGTDTLAVANATVTSSAAKLSSSNATRLSILILAVDGTIYVGKDSNVTSSNGLKIDQGCSFEERDYTGDIYVVTASSNVSVRYWEVG